MKLPAVLREAATHADAVCAETAIWLGGRPESLAAEKLWLSFVDWQFVPAGDIAVLGLLLLAEVLESAE